MTQKSKVRQNAGGEIVDSFVDKSGMYDDFHDDDYVDEFGEDVL